ncbi:RNA polymerase II subunit A C-terminal domain phosphatase [Tribolium madens]|uniref:RNA polymerase II subunit A C-terminal domain phosphatase n=1 Tax=Tribolium madens TaxID=41895 RepID=UPI001CF756FB|nr:RNA polymerase II subunit A C-terminal domain phosphatase [Tribolium madens]
MAEKTMCISQQQTKPIKILKWKVSEGNTVSIGRVILLYDFDGGSKVEQRKLKVTQAGTIFKIVAQEGAIVKPGETLCELKECTHPTVMNDMCAECGTDLRKNDVSVAASVPMVHAIPDLKVSEELAQKLGKADVERLIRDRKLVLLVDLDQTLIHTTNDHIQPNIKDIYRFQLYGPNSPWYFTRLRPGTHQFLNNIYPYYELHICTFGARNYAHMIAAVLDRDQKFFSNRILSRDECFDPTSKKANLKALFPCGDNMVCIIDDREDVWSNAANLIHVKPYHFFQHTGDINAPPGLDKHENDNKAGVDLTKIKDLKKDEQILNNDDNRVAENDSDKNSESKDENQVVNESDSIKNETKENTQDREESSKEKEDNNVDENKKGADVSEQKMENVDESECKGVNGETVTIDENPLPEESKTPTEDTKTHETKNAIEINNHLVEVEDPDDYLSYLEDILKRIHQTFYDAYDKMESGEVPDLKKVIPMVRSQVLQGCKLVFSGLVPTHIKLEQSKAYQIAKSLGAEVTQELEEETTHLVAVRPGTAKVNAGRRKKNLKIVTPDWLWCCAERWEHVDEKIFALNSKGSKNRHPPPHCSSPEHIISYPEHNTPAMRKRTPSGRFMDTINPLMSFSSADIADMDKEVEDILDDESDTSDEEKNAKGTVVNSEEVQENSSSSEDSLGEYPKGFKRKREVEDEAENDLNNSTEDDDTPSVKFRRGETVDSEVDMEPDSQESDGSVEAPDEVDDGEWNMMGAALEREFLSNN